MTAADQLTRILAAAVASLPAEAADTFKAALLDAASTAPRLPEREDVALSRHLSALLLALDNRD